MVHVVPRWILIACMMIVVSGSVHGQPAGATTTGSLRPVEKVTASEPLDSKTRVERWTQDVEYLAREFPAKHKNAFFKLSREAWDATIRSIRESIPTTTDSHLVLDLRRLIASIGDGHSNLWIDGQSTVTPFRQYQIAYVWLSDGLFVAALPEQHEVLIGQRVTRIGELPIDEVTRRVATVRGYDNQSGMKGNVVQDLREAETLIGLGIVGNDGRLMLTLADKDQNETSVTLEPLSGAPQQGDAAPPKIVAKPNPAEMGIGRRVPRPVFGHEILPDSKTFYIWYDTCSDQKDKTVAQFTEETIKALDEALSQRPPTVDRVVVDFRRNGGGSSSLFMPMIDALRRRDQINKKGGLFGLIGRRTFSSAVMNAWQLRKATHCLLVGEPTGGTPNGYGEVRKFALPNSKLVVQYSTKLWNLTGDNADAVVPDIPVTPDSIAFFSTQDPVLEGAMRYKPSGE